MDTAKLEIANQLQNAIRSTTRYLESFKPETAKQHASIIAIELAGTFDSGTPPVLLEICERQMEELRRYAIEHRAALQREFDRL